MGLTAGYDLRLAGCAPVVLTLRRLVICGDGFFVGYIGNHPDSFPSKRVKYFNQFFPSN
jgi:hypothetical protein